MVLIPKYIYQKVHCQKLIDGYPNDINNTFSTELKQFHSSTKKASVTHMELCNAITEDKPECLSKILNCLKIMRTSVVTDCTAEVFLTIETSMTPNRLVMVQERLDSLRT